MHLTGEIHVGVSGFLLEFNYLFAVFLFYLNALVGAGEEDWSMLLVEEALNLYYSVCKTLIMPHLFSFLVVCILVLSASISLELK